MSIGSWIWHSCPRSARRPTEAERSKYKSLYSGKPAAESLASLGVVLFNLNEFLYLE